MKRIDERGNTHGEWLVLDADPIFDGKLRAYWKCKCSCGYIKYIRGDNLRSGKSTKCVECNFGRGIKEL